MIRYQFTEAHLIALIEADDKAKGRKQGWLSKAKKLTIELKKKPAKVITSEWSPIKGVYTKIQHGKCAFCERVLGEHELASVEFDVEHFRPKNAVKAWPDQATIEALGLPADFPASVGAGRGYRLLAYHHLNYASSCKVCNERLKACFFPIAGKKHIYNGVSPQVLLKTEQPYLIYPLGDFDDDPQDMISFEGIMAVPRKEAGSHEHNRALVTIAFFRLNAIRDDLLMLRAKTLQDVFTKLELYEATASPKRRAEIWADILLFADERAYDVNCIRSFLRLYGEPDKPAPASRARAMEYLKLARIYWRSKFGPRAP